MAMAWLMGLGLALASVLWVELVRDCYHALAHVWSPLYRLHGWHHRVFRSDLSVVSTEIYQKAHWYNDVPEALVMLTLGIWPPLLTWMWQGFSHWPLILAACAGQIYTLGFLVSAIARGVGLPNADEITDLTHRPGPFLTPPAPWMVNRTYHWRHHFDDPNAYFCGTLTLVDKMLGTALSLKGKKIAVTGASGGFGQALLQELHQQGAKAIAITSCGQEVTVIGAEKTIPIRTEQWCIGQEDQLKDLLAEIDILVINHGVNVHQRRDGQAIQEAYEVNTFSALRLMELFLATVKTNRHIATKEIWVNTSEAEVNPAFSPLYELSKRTLGDVVTLKRLDSPCVIRKLILGPFKSKLNPVGIMSAAWVARQVVKGVKRDSRNIIVTINPITFIAFPVKEFFVSLYFRCFSKKS
jgi:hypothetical protein